MSDISVGFEIVFMVNERLPLIFRVRKHFGLGGVLMRPETKFQSTIKEILFTLLFIAGEMKRISFQGWPEINGP